MLYLLLFGWDLNIGFGDPCPCFVGSKSFHGFMSIEMFVSGLVEGPLNLKKSIPVSAPHTISDIVSAYLCSFHISSLQEFSKFGQKI